MEKGKKAVKSHAAPRTEMAHVGVFKDVFRETNEPLESLGSLCC